MRHPKIPILFGIVIPMAILHAVGLMSCVRKPSKSDIEIAFTQDTLHIGYTYWLQESGPFIGTCGEALSLVASGTLTALGKPNDGPGPLYTAQSGWIEVDQVFKIKELGEHTYRGQRIITSDCFYAQGLRPGDKVLVFCHDQGTDYTIQGAKSIIKITDFESPAIRSIRDYIDADENPLAIQKDTILWERHQLKEALLRIAACRKSEEGV